MAKELEARRRRLLSSNTRVEIPAGSSPPKVTTIAETTKRTSKSPEWCAFLYELVRAEGALSIVEMGTSVGVSGSYLAAAARDNGGGRLVTLEGLPGPASVAEAGFEELRLQADVVVGRFSETLGDALGRAAPVDLMFIDGHHHEGPTLEYFAQALPHLSPGALVAFDDIRWSEGMRRAWSKLERHPAVQWALDLHTIGLIRTEAS